MPRPYLTVAEWSKRHGIPNRTVHSWIKAGKIEARTDVYPYLVPDDQPVPRKDPDIHGWRYQFDRKNGIS